MPLPSLACSALLFVAGLFPPVQKKWDPLFDYTHLQPSNETYWESLGKVQVQMEQALELAEKTEGAPVRPLRCELKSGEDGSFWDLQLFVTGGQAPKRVNLQISAAEPKVLHRLELLSLAETEKEIWSVLSKVQTPAAIAIELSKEHSAGNKVEALITEPRVRKLEFVAEPLAPVWKCDLLGNETRKDLIRRYMFHINGAKPAVKQKLMLDRFAGEPLRAGQPTELDNGMYMFDLNMGDGPEVTADSKVKVHYRLFLLDNIKLHDTWETKRPETFVISSAPLKGMSTGMVGMKVGGKRKLAIPYELAFGEAGNDLAPPKAMVVCDVSIQALVP